MTKREATGIGRTVLLAAALCGAAPLRQPLRGQESVERLASRLDTLFAPYRTTRGGGCAVGASRDGLTQIERAYGMADLERSEPIDTATIFDAGSVSKQFTAAAVLLLAQRDSLSLDDDVRHWLPEVPDLGSRAITLWDLLHHTSGLREWGAIAALRGWPPGTAAYTNADVLDMVARQQALNFEPGTEFLYSNTNYNLLALVVQRVTGLSLAEYTRRALFLPLHMTHTSWRDDYRRVVRHRALSYVRGPEPYGYEGDRDDLLRTSAPGDDVYGSVGLLTTVGDLLRWSRELVRGEVLGPAVIARMQEPVVLSSGRRVGYGAGLFLSNEGKDRQVWHVGSSGGYRSFLALLPRRGIAVALLCNRSDADPFVIGQVLLHLVLGRPVSRVVPQADPSPGGDALRVTFVDTHSPFTGLYRDVGTAEAVRFVPDTARGPYARSPLVRVSSTEYRLASSPGVRLLVRSLPGQHRPRLLWIPPAGDTTLLEPVEPFPPGARLGDYVGDWYSPEMDATIRVVPEDDGLVAVLRAARMPLLPIYADAFAAPGAIFRFDRNAAGQVTGLGVWAPRARDIRFRRRLR